MTLFEWMRHGRKGDDDQIVRATLGRLLFTGDDGKKSVRVLSGGEKGRMLYGKLMLERPNVLVMDEPTNHMDMESIESLQLALEHYKGTLIFVSHDRQFVSSLATQVIELGGAAPVHFHGQLRGLPRLARDRLTGPPGRRRSLHEARRRVPPLGQRLAPDNCSQKYANGIWRARADPFRAHADSSATIEDLRSKLFDRVSIPARSGGAWA